MDAFCFKKCKNKSFSLSQLNKHQEKYFLWKMAIFHSREITKQLKQGQYYKNSC